MHKNTSNSCLQQLHQLEKLLHTLHEQYFELSSIISKENDAIRSANLKALETLVSAKVMVADFIEGAIRDIRSIGQSASSQLANSDADQITLTNVLDAVCGAARSQSLGDGILIEKMMALHRDCRQWVEKIASQREQHAEQVAVNRMVLERMLEVQQENYRFWQAVAEESATTYGAHGERKGEGQTSILKVQV